MPATRKQHSDREASDSTKMAVSRKLHLVCLLGLSLLSGVLLYLAFPPADLWPLAYVALVPFFGAVAASPSWKIAAFCGLATGLAAYVPGFAWLCTVHVAGWIGLSVYVALYLAIGAVALRALQRRFPRLWPALAGCTWVALELIRSLGPTGFPWLLLGYTQYRFPALLQMASVTGVYGISFAVAFFNASLAAGVLPRIARSTGRPAVRRSAVVTIGLALILIAVGAGVGDFLSARLTLTVGPVVGVVQHNVPRLVSEYFGPEQGEPEQRVRGEIDKVALLSRKLKGRSLDLLVWPETTVGVPLNPDTRPYLVDWAQQCQDHAWSVLAGLAADLECHLLVGAPYWRLTTIPARPVQGYGPRIDYHPSNSAFLVSPEGRAERRYDKMHLVPFGEYTPLGNVLPFLRAFTPFERELEAGQQPVVFHLAHKGGNNVGFAVPICYEDIFPALVLAFRRRGAQFLVNVTDEGWYRVPGELRQHLAMAVFRAVETRTTVVRAANTGISCFIDPRGRIYRMVSGEKNGRISVRDVAGEAAAPVLLCETRTPYVRFGNWFAWMCLAATLLVPGAAKLAGSTGAAKLQNE